VASKLRKKRAAAFAGIDLYPVTCESLSNGRSNIEVLQGFIAGGAKVVQLRDKEAAHGDVYRMAVAFREMTAAAGMLRLNIPGGAQADSASSTTAGIWLDRLVGDFLRFEESLSKFELAKYLGLPE